MRRLGSDFGNVIREDFTAYQLASWLILLLDRDKAINITRAEAEDIGKGVTAALLNRGSLSKAERSTYTKQVRERSNLDDDIKIREYELKSLQAEMKKADQELRQRQKLIDELDVKLKAHKGK